jgi:Zn-dependent peptidase ImmA (M78 family)
MQTPRVKIDGRRKLSEEQKEEIRDRYNTLGNKESQRTLAKQYGVSRRLIVFILYPDRLKALQDKNRQEQHWKKYYNRKQLTEAMQNWRNKLKADKDTKQIYLDYIHEKKAQAWKRKEAKDCPYCGKIVKAMRDHVRRQHENIKN